tara:strand:+ start:401 stop:574 length:174 start_codon:yes stop_codon:yes gene_type:complete
MGTDEGMVSQEVQGEFETCEENVSGSRMVVFKKLVGSLNMVIRSAEEENLTLHSLPA